MVDIEDLHQQISTATSIKCIKCHNVCANINLPFQRKYCKCCFMVTVQRRFQLYLKKIRNNLQDKSVIIAFSGGISSSTLLSLLHQNIFKYTRIKYPFKPIVVHIDFSSVESEESKLKNKPLYDYLSRLNIEYYIYYKNHFEPVCQPDNSQLFSHTILMEYLKQIAHEKNAAYILTGHNCDHISTLSITMMAIGQGHSVIPLIGSNINTVDDSIVKIGKPLKDLLLKELAFYYIYQKIENLTRFDNSPTILDEADETTAQNQLLYSCTNEFLKQLQISNECTFSTILRTLEKFKNS